MGAKGTPHLSFHLDDFILKIIVLKVVSQAENQISATVNAKNTTVNIENLIKRLIEKATVREEKLTANHISILRLMAENPYITKDEIAAITSLNASTIMRKIEFMRDKYLHRVGSDKNGFWEIHRLRCCITSPTKNFWLGLFLHSSSSRYSLCPFHYHLHFPFNIPLVGSKRKF